MTRLETLMVGIVAAALSLALAALFLYFLIQREASMSFAVSMTLAGTIAVLVPAVVATVTGRTIGPRGVTAWLLVFGGICLLLGAIFGYLIL